MLQGLGSMPKVAVIMGSKSDYEHLVDGIKLLRDFGIETTVRVVSAHRTPSLMYEFARSAREEGYEVIIAAAGGAAHLPGMTASMTTLPVIGVPVPSRHLKGIDSLLSIVQMPSGVPVATVAIGNSVNAALLALRILSIRYREVEEKLAQYMKEQEQKVLAQRVE
ncbi:5-(carboxyamino)imidazole ribonucleotide mutase [Thermogymnomonas acidicola]|uniref:N5-carboxyaminoimidazole ribonucleotide mutase n=2 Tax=Thermogymnomonas acidicola TaxID=399579 RepID=A0AA37F966_9ARCH|nr:5-(carboxyamino)imidazole ribonucleotide mutase [Thermogymnomonas acidicola]